MFTCQSFKGDDFVENIEKNRSTSFRKEKRGLAFSFFLVSKHPSKMSSIFLLLLVFFQSHHLFEDDAETTTTKDLPRLSPKRSFGENKRESIASSFFFFAVMVSNENV